MYNAYAVKTGKLCPVGWHVPSEAEWNKLITYLGGPEVADNKLRSTTGWTGDFSATDSSRLTILPGGYRDAGGEFQFINEVARFWTSTAFGSIANAVISIDTSHVENINNHHVSGNSIRCIKD